MVQERGCRPTFVPDLVDHDQRESDKEHAVQDTSREARGDLCIYLTLSLDAHVETARATSGTVLHSIGELHDDARFVVTDGKGVAGTGRIRHILQQVLRSAPGTIEVAKKKLLKQVISGTCEATRTGLVEKGELCPPRFSPLYCLSPFGALGGFVGFTANASGSDL